MHFTINHPSTADPDTSMRYVKSIVYYIMQCMKYSTKHAKEMFNGILEKIGNLDYQNYKIYDIIFGINYLK